MGLGSGLSSQLGFSEESTYGTYVAPTKFIPVSQFEVKRRSYRSQGEGIRVGGLAPLGSLHGETHNDAMGSASFEVTNRGLGLLYQALMGGTDVTPSQLAATEAYEATFSLGDTSGRSLTMQGGVPLATPGGDVNPFTLLGGKIMSMEFSCQVGELLKCSVEIDGASFTTGQTLATASFATGVRPFTFQQATVSAGTYDSETTVSGVKGFTLRISRPHDTERYYLGGGATKTEPALNAFSQIGGSLNLDYIDDTFVDHVANATAPSLVILFEGAADSAGTGYEDTIRFTIPQVQITDGNPAVSGPGTVAASFNFSATDDGTNPAAEIYTINKDTTL
jgi:hypothetical protein